MKQVEFKDLVARKLQKERDQLRVEQIEVPSLGGTLTFKKPSDAIVIDTIDAVGDGSSTAGVVAAYKRLIYLTCDMLQNPKLHDELGIVDPMDTVDAIFDLADIMRIGEKLSDFIGFGGVSDEIKN